MKHDSNNSDTTKLNPTQTKLEVQWKGSDYIASFGHVAHSGRTADLAIACLLREIIGPEDGHNIHTRQTADALINKLKA